MDEKWKKTEITFSGAIMFTWGDKQTALDILKKIEGGGGGVTPILPGLAKLDDKQKKKIIKLICKVKGIEYNDSKEIKNIKITAKNIQLVIKEVLGISVKIK